MVRGQRRSAFADRAPPGGSGGDAAAAACRRQRPRRARRHAADQGNRLGTGSPPAAGRRAVAPAGDARRAGPGLDRGPGQCRSRLRARPAAAIRRGAGARGNDREPARRDRRAPRRGSRSAGRRDRDPAGARGIRVSRRVCAGRSGGACRRPRRSVAPRARARPRLRRRPPLRAAAHPPRAAPGCAARLRRARIPHARRLYRPARRRFRPGCPRGRGDPRDRLRRPRHGDAVGRPLPRRSRARRRRPRPASSVRPRRGRMAGSAARARLSAGDAGQRVPVAPRAPRRRGRSRSAASRLPPGGGRGRRRRRQPSSGSRSRPTGRLRRPSLRLFNPSAALSIQPVQLLDDTRGAGGRPRAAGSGSRD